MQPSIEEIVKQDIQSGKDEFVVKNKVKKLNLDKELTAYLMVVIDDEISLEKIREVRRSDANTLVYTGFFFMALAILFGLYSRSFGILIFGLGFVIKRRGDKKKKEAGSIQSLEELLPDHTRKFR